jgi:UDP-N-acetylmuramoyl-tripeptide--D-alanyl-D-alanine ligase
VNAFPVWILSFGILVFGWKRVLAYLRYYQQEEYSSKRFWNWLKEKRAFDTRGSLVVIAVAILTWVIHGYLVSIIIAGLGAAALCAITLYYEEDPRKAGKIKLSMTDRATKIAWLAYGLFALITVAPLCFSCCSSCHTARPAVTSMALYAIFLIELPPFLLMLANSLLWPAEKALQDGFYNDAKRIMAEVNPYVIGITGSYGKTGAKAALGELLNQCLGPTFWPKKSINTVMGITRSVREDLGWHHRYAVMEMGAYNIGSIKRLCDFTPPKAALVTSVGIMHLERFGSPENVYVAKSEIAQALPFDGILVCNGDSPNARRMATEHGAKTTLLYGLDTAAGPLDCLATDISFSEKGTSFVIHWKGQRYPGSTPLLGRPALLNILGAFTMACALGADPIYATACLANLEPVDNRLVLDRRPDVSYLRDAYNSNPTGFEAALEVLKNLPAARRIVMTPGMIELGSQQYEQNKRLASIAAEVADMFIAVGKVNREALVTGLEQAKYAREKLIVVDTRDEAFSVIASRGLRGDLVLIENDLGDLLEGRVRF